MHKVSDAENIGNINTLDDYFMLSFYALICFHQVYAAGIAAKRTLIRKKLVFITDNAQSIQLAMNMLRTLLWSMAWATFFAVNLNKNLTPVHIGYKLKEQCFPMQPTDTVCWQWSWTLLQFSDNWQWCSHC